MKRLGPEMDDFVWPETNMEAVDDSLCFHSRRFLESLEMVDSALFEKLPLIVNSLERLYCCTKVVYGGWPQNFEKLIRDKVEWKSSPGWPWKKWYPTNKDLFMFDGVRCAPERVAMIETAVRIRWNELVEEPKADPIHTFIKQEPHKVAKAKNKTWRIISGVGLTDTLVDEILFGNWLDKNIKEWPKIPSKPGWAPQLGGFKWMAKAFRGKNPICIDKSSWDWTVNAWDVSLMMRLVPRMVFNRTIEWDAVFRNRMIVMYGAGYPIFKPSCGCEFVQLVDGIHKSGMKATITFNSIWQVGRHLAAGGSEEDLIFSMGDDTAQEEPPDLNKYLEELKRLGAIVKEVDEGWPITFAGHYIDEKTCLPVYRSKHMFDLLHLEEKVGPETLESYRHLYALDDEMSLFLERLALRKYGPTDLLSREYLREWYMALE